MGSVRWEPRQQLVILTPRQVEAHRQSLKAAEDLLAGSGTKAMKRELEKQIQHTKQILFDGGYIHEHPTATGMEHTVPAHLWKCNEAPAKKEAVKRQPVAEMATYSVNNIGQLEIVFPELAMAQKAVARGNMNDRLRAMNKAKAQQSK